MRGNREIIVENGICFIPLTKGNQAIADEQDLHLIEGGSWFSSGRSTKPHVYAVRHDAQSFAQSRNRSASIIRMHRMLMGNPIGMFVDHINGDTLDNRRANLRVVTLAQNAKNRALSRNNTSGTAGVNWDKFEGCWEAVIYIEGKQRRIGRFQDYEQACAARKVREDQIYGKFVRGA